MGMDRSGACDSCGLRWRERVAGELCPVCTIRSRIAALEAQLAETRADLEWFAAHRVIVYRDWISYAVEPGKAWRKDATYDGTPEDLRRVIRAARRGEI